MLVLFDNGTPRTLARFLIDHHMVTESRARGWEELENGELLNEAEAAGFEVLVTTTTISAISRILQAARLRLSYWVRVGCRSGASGHPRQLCRGGHPLRVETHSEAVLTLFRRRRTKTMGVLAAVPVPSCNRLPLGPSGSVMRYPVQPKSSNVSRAICLYTGSSSSSDS